MLTSDKEQLPENDKKPLAENKTSEKDKTIIDAGETIKAYKKERENIEGERGAFNLTAKHIHLPTGSKTFLLVVVVLISFIVGAFMQKAWKLRNLTQNSAGGNNQQIANMLPPLEPRVFKPAKNEEILGIVETPTTEAYKEEYQEESINANPVQTRKLSSELTTSGSSNSNNISSQQQSTYHGQDDFKGSSNELQSRLEPLRLTPSVAGKLENRDYLLTQGAIIDCQLETRMITTQPGMTSCYVTRNIYSANGRVILIDRGSKIVGNYQGGITQGQARIFVLWSRIETPKGVIIDLDSPGSGSLGESGVGGYIDTHFWERFKGAIMMSFIGDFGQIVNNRTAKNNKGGNNIQLTNTTQGLQEAAVEALRNSINIPPTLYKNQGERITIFVARDLDFAGVYGLEPE
jgi:type IV secretion system protein VirB10